MTNRYALDRSNGKILGVCAGLARTTNIGALPIRIAAVLSLFLLGPLSIVIYFLVGWLAD